MPTEGLCYITHQFGLKHSSKRDSNVLTTGAPFQGLFTAGHFSGAFCWAYTGSLFGGGLLGPFGAQGVFLKSTAFFEVFVFILKSTFRTGV